MLTRWIPWRFILKRAAKAYGIIDPLSLLARMRRFAQPSEVQEPIELLRAGIIFHARGLINTKAIQHNLDWVWPYWVERQFNPADPSFIPRAFSFSHVNLTHRNWTALGQPDSDLYPIIDPRGLITPHFDGWSLDFWLVDPSGNHLLPSQEKDCRQHLELDPDMILETTVSRGPRTLVSRATVQLDGGLERLNIAVRAEAEPGVRLAVTVRPYNPEGIQFIDRIDYDTGNRALKVNRDRPIELADQPERVCLSSYPEGDVLHKLEERSSPPEVACKVGMASAALLFPMNDSGAREIRLNIPLQPGQDALGGSRPAQTWPGAKSQTPALQIPDQDIQWLFENAVQTLLLLSSREIVPGPYTYKRFWFRDACLMLNSLLVLNLEDRCRRVIEGFPDRQKLSGYFQSQEGEWDSNGQVLWILSRFHRLTGTPCSRGLLESARKGVRWLGHKRTDFYGGARHAGLLPAGFSAEHLGPNDYYYWDNLWAWAGLEGASSLFSLHGMPGEASEAEALAGEFRRAVETSLAAIPEKQSRGGIPASPYRRMDAGAIGSLVGDYPLQLFDAGDQRIISTAEYLLDNCFHDGGFFQDMIHSGINPYLTLAIAQTMLRIRDLRFRDLIRSVAGLASPTGHWPEAIHPITKGGCMGDGQHGWAAAEWVMILRNLFVREEPDGLIIGSGLFPEWLAGDQELFFGPTLTPFGAVSVRFRKAQETLRVDVQTEPDRPAPPVLLQVPGYETIRPADLSQTVTLNPADRS